MFCDQCGFNNRDDAKFCKSCGKPLNVSQPQSNTQNQVRNAAQQYAQNGRGQTSQNAGKMAAKTGGSFGKKLLGSVILVGIAIVAIPFISGVIEGVQEVTNNPSSVVQPVKNEPDLDYKEGQKT